jgi:hypothetical protein
MEFTSLTAFCDNLGSLLRLYPLQTGMSRIHWHTGAGKNRQDYYGRTVFQEQRQVLWGKFFKSGLLNEAGANADFDQVQNSGIITIPIDNLYNKQQTLILRVMDYDWGKRDDLLGELELNATALAESGKKQTFGLTRNGKVEQGKIKLSAKIVPYEALFPMKSASSGAAVSPIVYRPNVLVLRVHQATNLRSADWIGKNDVYVQAYAVRPDDPIQPGKALPKPDQKMILPMGETIFPFAVQLRHDAPGSAELRVGDQSWVRYFLQAYVDFANWRDPCFKRYIQVLPNRPLPTLRLLSPYLSESMNQPIHTCCCFQGKCNQVNGLISIRLQSDRLAYAPGESIDLTGSEIKNESSVALMAWGILTCHIILRASYGRTTSRSVDYTLFTLPVPPDSVTLLENEEGALGTAIIPAVFPSFYGGVPGPLSLLGPALKWTYTFSLKVGFEKAMCKGEVKVECPILISAAAPYASTIQQAIHNQNKDPNPPPRLNENFWVIFQHSVVGPEACYTAPTLTGSDNGGDIVSIDDCPAYGTHSYSGDPEDRYMLPGPDHQIQPSVNTFDGPLALSADGNPSALYGGGSGSSQSAALNQLLKEMERSVDMRRTVGEWAKKNTQYVQSLSPQDWETILRNVTFSLDQTAVIGELLTNSMRFDYAIYGDVKTVTCAHVVAAMNVCQYQKLDVAQLMAPHVKDPENTQIVLKQLDFAYERKMVQFKPVAYEFA